MRTNRVREFIQYMQANVGSNGNTDMFYRWLEEAMTEIFSKEWTWNWKIVRNITDAPITETAGTFTWTVGQDYITCSSTLSDLNYTHTGRTVTLGERLYQINDVGVKNSSRVYLTRRLSTTSTAPATLTFHRDHKYYKTSKIRNVAVGNCPKLARYGSNDLRQYWLLSDIDDLESGTTHSYQDIVVERISPPAFPPKYVTSGAGTFVNGKYIYFYTKYDSESGLESEPGPMLIQDVTDGNHPTITYDNTSSADHLEKSSYSLRLYRSEVILPTEKRPRTRVPMHLVQQRHPKNTPLTDDNSTLRGKERYWDGAWSGVRLLPKPDEALRFDVECLNDCGGRLHDEDFIKLGNNDEVLQLIRLYLAGVSKLKALDVETFHKSLIAFRRQQAHLLTSDREPGKSDSGPRNTHNYSMDTQHSGDWVDHLSSPWNT